MQQLELFNKILYRPVGLSELKLIEESGWKKFPPRLPEQPIFYPVCSREYAQKIAKEWNTKKGKGFVVAFEVDIGFLNKYETHLVGGSKYEEYWIPAEDLDKFNDAICSYINIVDEYENI